MPGASPQAAALTPCKAHTRLPRPRLWVQFRTHLALLTASGLVSMENCKALELSVHDLWAEMGDDHASVWYSAGGETLEDYVPDLAHIFSLVWCSCACGSCILLPLVVSLDQSVSGDGEPVCLRPCGCLQEKVWDQLREGSSSAWPIACYRLQCDVCMPFQSLHQSCRYAHWLAPLLACPIGILLISSYRWDAACQAWCRCAWHPPLAYSGTHLSIKASSCGAQRRPDRNEHAQTWVHHMQLWQAPQGWCKACSCSPLPCGICCKLRTKR